MLDTRQIHPMSDFVRNPKQHVARIKETRTPEVLTVNGRAEIVLLDTEPYENLVERLRTLEEISTVRTIIRKSEDAGPDEEATQEEIERSQAIVREIMAETERMGLYKLEAERHSLNQ